MRMILLAMAWLLSTVLHCQNSPEIQTQKNLQTQYLSKLKLQPWIVEEYHQRNVNKDDTEVTMEAYVFELESSERLFHWSINNDKELRIRVMVSEVDDKGEFKVIGNAQEDEFVKVDIADEPESERMRALGKVYIERQFKVNVGGSGKFLRFMNYSPKNVLVMLYLQSVNTVVEWPKEMLADSSLTPSNTNLANILMHTFSEQSIREHQNKEELGYQEKEIQHYSSYLGLTGIELLTIFVTALLQLYFIRSLLDRRAIV